MSSEPNSTAVKSNQNLAENMQSLSQLKAWLASKKVDISQWGRGTAKSLESLWDEVRYGEVYLQDNPPLRVINVVQVIIRKKDKILIESEQEFDDERRRSRNHPPSEKMRRGENYVEAASRCLQEELGLKRQDFEILSSTYQQKQKELESPSYPNLHTCYIFHIVEARVSNLPETNFWTDESAQNQQDPIRRHYWTWQANSHQID